MNAAIANRRAAQTRKSISDWVLARLGPTMLGLPSIILLTGFFVLPVGMILAQSFFAPDFTLSHYQRILTMPVYWLVFSISLKIALISTVVSMAASYFVASTLLFVRPVSRSIILAVILVPFWTNVLIRCYAWILLLQKSGLVNGILVNSFHVLTQPLPLLFNLTSVLIGLVHYLIPVNILVLYTSMQRIDLRLLQAAKGLGANPLIAFLAVFVPLSVPGVFAASMLIFVISLGFFVTPALLGGPQEITMAMMVSSYFTETVDWGLGSALATVLLVSTLIFVGFYLLFQRRALAR
jgi:ABC-type spermidine/putrescine transport system permease subunit I